MSKLKRCLFSHPYLTSRQSKPDVSHSLMGLSNRALAALPLGLLTALGQSVVGHRDEAAAEGLEVTLLQGTAVFPRPCCTPGESLAGRGGWWEGEREEERHNTSLPEKRRGFCTEDSAPRFVSLLTCPINHDPVPGS